MAARMKRKRTVCVDASEVPRSLRRGLTALAEEYPIVFKPRRDSVCVRWLPQKGEKGYRLVRNGGGIDVVYGRPIDAFRALGCILAGEPRAGGKSDTQKAHFEMLGVMMDCSRNAAPRVSTLKKWLRRMALMGVNTLLLYIEDMYTVPGEPYFGYMRGRYTQRELREIDSHAALFGIEVIPCIQTLGHLAQILKWPAYADVADTPHELLVGERATYRLIEKMIKAVSGAVRSRRIHIGMDEAVTLGTGRYRKKHGDRPAFQIVIEHLHRVCAITKQLGLRPMIWDDALFRVGSKTGDYYDDHSVIPASVRRAIPAELELVYWDYYHTTTAHYARHIEKHASLGRRVIGAPCIYTHGRFWPDFAATRATVIPFMKAARKAGVEDMFITCWFDSGAECNPFAALPLLQTYADFGYGPRQDDRLTRARVTATCKMSLDDYERASLLDVPPGKTARQGMVLNTSRPLLWEDPINGLLAKDIPRNGMTRHYKALAVTLGRAALRDEEGLLKRAAQLARVLTVKAELWGRMVAAYQSRDAKTLLALVRNDVSGLRREMTKLWKLHRREWLSYNKPFGFEVLESRYGTLLARMDALADRVQDYAAGRIDRIEEWDEKHLKLGRELPMDTGFVKEFRPLLTTTVMY